MKVEENKVTEEKDMNLVGVLLETQREYAHSNKMKDKIIILLIVCMLIETLAFVWYESQYTYLDGEYATKTIEMDASGDSANTEYNDVAGDMYKDEAVHNGRQEEGD